MKLKDNSTQEIDTALYQLEQRLKSNIRLTDVENSNASTAKINAVDKKLTEEVKDRQSADGKLQDNINKEIADRQEADAAIENAKQDKLIAGDNIQINGNIISATSKEYTAEAPVKVTDGKISLDTVPVNKGGTGVTTQEDINKAFIGNLTVGNDNVTDGTEFVSSWASDNGFAETADGALNSPYKRQFVKVWNYIKGKISSVLGLTKDNYGGKASTAGNADTVDNYHASQLWRNDGATWNPNANVSLNATANGDEWSFDISRNGHTGCYWQVWDENKNTLLRVNADDGKVSAPYGFVGNLSGKADTAVTADTAGTANIAKNMYSQTFDLSSLDKTKFYPLVCPSNYNFAEVAIFSEGGMASAEYNQNRIHFDISTMGWSDTPPTLNIREYSCYENNEITIGCIGRGVHNGAWAIWLRGGVRYYCFSRDVDLSLKTSDYTYGDEVYTVGTNYYGGSNTNVSVWFTPQSTITEGAYSTRPITAPRIKANNKMIIPIGAPSSLEDGCIWIER